MPASRYLILAFLEGAFVLAVELAGGKIISSYYGSSLVVWTSVVGITLIFLTAGYFTGGRMSTRKNISNLIFQIILLSCLLIALVPLIAQPVLKWTYHFNFYIGSILAATIIMGLPLATLATLSPLLIQLASGELNSSGKTAGRIYAVSTAGGIFISFLLAFAIIPNLGITVPLIVMAIFLGNAALVLFFDKTRMIAVSALLTLLVFEAVFFSGKKFLAGKNYRITYQSEGMLGQLRVLDNQVNNDRMPIRRLLINGIPQTHIINEPGYAFSLWNYVHMVAVFSTLKPANSKALLLGFGGGSIATELTTRGFEIDAVEIDKRMLPLAKNYFYFNPGQTDFIVDDARHHIETVAKKYDLIVIDLLNGEVQPSYVFTRQSFQQMKQVLKSDGIIIIEYQGYLFGKNGKGCRSIFKTLQESGFQAYYHTRADEHTNESTDVIFIASPQPVDFSKITLGNINPCCNMILSPTGLLDEIPNKRPLNLSDAVILDDDKMVLEHYNMPAIIEWRREMIRSITNVEMEEGIKIFR